MKKQIPSFIKDDEELSGYLEFLDDLRSSGVTNMYGAGTYIQEVFGIGNNVSTEILRYWMDTFSKRHSSEKRG